MFVVIIGCRRNSEVGGVNVLRDELLVKKCGIQCSTGILKDRWGNFGWGFTQMNPIHLYC